MGSRQCKLLSVFLLLSQSFQLFLHAFSLISFAYIQSFCVILKLNKSCEFAIYAFFLSRFSSTLCTHLCFILWTAICRLPANPLEYFVGLKLLETIFHFHSTMQSTYSCTHAIWLNTDNVILRSFKRKCYDALSVCQMVRHTFFFISLLFCMLNLLHTPFWQHFNWRFWTWRVKITRRRAEIKHSLQIHCISKHRIRADALCVYWCNYK